MTRGVGAKEPEFLLVQEGHGGWCKEAWTAACAGMTRWPPSPGGALGTAGLSRGGERRTGLLLTQEGHCGPLTRPAWTAGHPLPRWGEAYRTAACAGRTPAPACAGRTRGASQPARPSALPPARPALPAVGRGVLDCCLRRKDTKGHIQRSLGSCLRRNDTCWVPACAGITLWPPSPGGALGTAGLSRGGERRTGFLLAQE
jgi:hypothetical protein